jgi:hypothetical protein
VHPDGLEVETCSPYHVDISLGDGCLKACLTRKCRWRYTDFLGRRNVNGVVIEIRVTIRDQAKTSGGTNFEKGERLGEEEGPKPEAESPSEQAHSFGCAVAT